MPNISTKTIDLLGNIAEDQPFVEDFFKTINGDEIKEIEIATIFLKLCAIAPISEEATSAMLSIADDLDGETFVAMDSIENQTKNADAGWLVFFEGRRTGVAVAAETRSQAISKARKRKKRGGNKVVSARRLTSQETKTAAAGKWIKSRPPGFKESMRGKGPKPKAAK